MYGNIIRCGCYLCVFEEESWDAKLMSFLSLPAPAIDIAGKEDRRSPK